ncbi:hypothetical protein BDW74DRAFT_175871 [Aspergillus multicolor]|uniref:glycosyltransferase n=1 Tax=Aspergillus multicolor TaxID=41759 RepID=UPI003CCCB2A4
MSSSILLKQEKAHIIIGANPLFGHFEKLKQIGADLVNRGYPVTILTGTSCRGEVESIGANFAALKGRANYNPRDFRQILLRNEPVLVGSDYPAWGLKTFIIDPIPDQHECLQALLASFKGEEIVYIDDTGFGAMIPTYLGAPNSIRPNKVIKVGTSPLPHASTDIPAWGLGLPLETVTSGKSSEEGLFFSSIIQKPFEAAISATGAPCDNLVPFITSLSKWSDLYLTMSIPEFEYPRSDLPDNVRFIGTLPAVGSREKDRVLPEWWEEVVLGQEKHKKPIVVITQGSVHNNPQDLILPTIEALKDEDVIVITTLVGLPESMISTSKNLKIAEFIPFDILFNHTTVLVSNGGYGVVQLALSKGLPMVLAGTGADKAETNAHAAWMGAAINLETRQPRPDQIREAVRAVLSNPKRKMRCEEIKNEYAKYDMLGMVAAAIEELALPTSRPQYGSSWRFSMLKLFRWLFPC